MKKTALLPKEVIISNLVSNIFYLVKNIKQSDIDKANLPITVNELHIIATIGRNIDSTSQAIADKLGVDKSTLSINLSKLEKKQFIKKIVSKKDKRKYQLTLTNKGKEAYELNIKFHKDLVDNINQYASNNEELIPVLEGFMHFLSKKNKEI